MQSTPLYYNTTLMFKKKFVLKLAKRSQHDVSIFYWSHVIQICRAEFNLNLGTQKITLALSLEVVSNQECLCSLQDQS